MKSRTKLIVASVLISSTAALLWAQSYFRKNAILVEGPTKVFQGIPPLAKIQTLQHSSFVEGVAWFPNGQRLATYSQSGGLITIWRSDGLRLKDLIRLEGIPDYGNSFVFLSDANLLLAAARHKSAEDQQVAFNIWDVNSGTVISDVDGPEPDRKMLYNRPVAFTASFDRKYVASTTNQGDEPVILYDTQDWSILRRISITNNESKYENAMSVAITPDGGLLAIGLVGSGDILIIDLKHSDNTPSVLHAYPSNYPIGIASLAFSTDGHFLATGADRRFGPEHIEEPFELAEQHAPIKIWQVADQKLVSSFPGDYTPIRQLSWSPNGSLLAAAAGDRTARLIAPLEPSNNISVTSFNWPVSSVQFSPNGHALAVASGTDVKIFTLGN